jgi:hypothetical protein
MPDTVNKGLTEILPSLLKRIRDELLLWLFAFITLAVIAGQRDRLIFFAVLGVGAVIIVVRLIVSYRQAIGEGKSNIPLMLQFKGKSHTDVKLIKCRYELSDSQKAGAKKQGELSFSQDNELWVCYLPSEIASDDIIRLVVTEQNGHKWESGPFRPLYINKEVKPAQ